MDNRRAVICGSLKQLETMNWIADMLRSHHCVPYPVVPDPRLPMIDAYFRHIDAIKKADFVVILPKGIDKPTGSYRLEPGVPYQTVRAVLDAGGIKIGEATMYEMCIAHEFWKPIYVLTGGFDGRKTN